MKKKVARGLVAASFMFALIVGGLAFTPHVTCGCPKYEDGSQLTHVINSVSEAIIARPIIEKNSPPSR